jgi:hypothetical protein
VRDSVHVVQTDRDIERQVVGNGSVLESLKGEAAVGYLKSLQMRKPQGFRAAEAKLRQRGYQPTDTINVHRLLSGRFAASSLGACPAQTTASDGVTEIVMWSWDDGDPSTWEGEVYMSTTQADGSHSEILSDTQLSIPSAEAFASVWKDVVYEDSTPAGGPEYRYAKMQMPRTERAGQSRFMSTVSSRGMHRAAVRVPAPVKKAFACALATCTVVAAGCWLSGVAFPGCFTAGCTITVLGCVLQQLLECIFGLC